jgi:hypothetical protein
LNTELANMEAVKTRKLNKPSSVPAKAAAAEPPPRARDPLESMEDVVEFMLKSRGRDKAGALLAGLAERLRAGGMEAPRAISTPYVNTIPVEKEPPYPGNRHGAPHQEFRPLERHGHGRQCQPR